MHIIFCADPLAPRAVDDAYTDEAQAAMASGLEYHLISYEQLVHEHDAAAAVRRVPRAEAPELALYRGWMMRPSDYQALYDALCARGIKLIKAPLPTEPATICPNPTRSFERRYRRPPGCRSTPVATSTGSWRCWRRLATSR